MHRIFTLVRKRKRMSFSCMIFKDNYRWEL